MNSCRIADSGLVGFTDTSPPPWVLVCKPWSLSQLRRLMSWFAAQARVGKRSCRVDPARVLMSGLTIKDVPPRADPETTLIAVPCDFLPGVERRVGADVGGRRVCPTTAAVTSAMPCWKGWVGQSH